MIEVKMFLQDENEVAGFGNLVKEIKKYREGIEAQNRAKWDAEMDASNGGADEPGPAPNPTTETPPVATPERLVDPAIVGSITPTPTAAEIEAELRGFIKRHGSAEAVKVLNEEFGVKRYGGVTDPAAKANLYARLKQ